MVHSNLAAATAHVQPEERTGKSGGSTIGNLMSMNLAQEKCLLDVAVGVGGGGLRLPPFHMNQPSRAWTAGLGKSYKAECASSRTEVCQLAGINIKDYVRRIITLNRAVWNLAGTERLDEAIGC